MKEGRGKPFRRYTKGYMYRDNLSNFSWLANKNGDKINVYEDSFMLKYYTDNKKD